MRIRKFKIEDAAEAARLHRGTIRTINKSDYSPSQIAAWSKRTSAESFRSSHDIAVRFVAIEGEKIIGFCDFKKNEPEKFWGLYVHRDHLGKGVGSRLMKKAMASAKKMGAKKFNLMATTTAKSFYEKQGFRIIKKMKHQIDDQKLDVYEMEKDSKSLNTEISKIALALSSLLPKLFLLPASGITCSGSCATNGLLTITNADFRSRQRMG